MESKPIQVTLGPPVKFRTIPGAHIISPGTEFSSNGMWCSSPNSEYVLILQNDGNLVLYRVIGTPGQLKQGVTLSVSTLWRSKTAGHKGDVAIMQEDGNLVVYSNPDPRSRKVLGESKTAGINPSGLYVQDDGNVVIYKLEPSGWSTDHSHLYP